MAARWDTFAASDPDLADRVLAIFTGHPHHVVASVRPDGAPRVGGTNVYVTDGVLWIGMMPTAARIEDLRREPRCALHSAPVDEQLSDGDVRLDLTASQADAVTAGRLLDAIGYSGGAGGVVFTLEIRQVTLVRVDGDELVLDVWRPPASRSSRRLRG